MEPHPPQLRPHAMALANAGLVALGIALSCALLEVGARLKLRSNLPDAGTKGYYVADEDNGYDLRENFPRTPVKAFEKGNVEWVWSNELGCFDEPFAAGGAGSAPPVLLVGDSFTQTLAFEENWGSRLERLAGERVLKCGVIGFGTKQELFKAKRILAKTGVRPSLILVSYYMNDFEDDYTFPLRTVVDGRVIGYRNIADYDTGRLADQPLEKLKEEVETFERIGEIVECPSDRPIQRLKCGLFRHSALYRIVKKRVKEVLAKSGALSKAAGGGVILAPSAPLLAWIPPESKPWVAKAWSAHLATLRQFKELARRHQAKLLIVIFPSREQVYSFLPRDRYDPNDMDRPNKILRRFLGREKIPYLDLLEPFRARADMTPRARLDPEKDLYFRLDWHMGPKGHELASLLIARHLLERKLLPSAGTASSLKAVERQLERFPARSPR